MRRDDVLSLLAESRVFSCLDPEAAASFAEHFEHRRYARSTLIMTEGEPGEHAFLIASGTVRIFRKAPSGKVAQLARRRRGDFFGELALFDGGPRSADVEAVSSVEMLLLQRDSLFGMIAEEPRVLDAILRQMGGLMRTYIERTAMFVFADCAARIARHIVFLAEATPDGHLLRQDRVTQLELAQMVGVSRQAANAALKELTDAGAISIEIDGIRVRSMDLLRRRMAI